MRHRPLLVLILLILLPCSAAPAEPGPGEPLTILLSNDDGIDAPGLVALYEALAPVATVTVAAPASEESGTGHSLTYREPILVHPLRHRDGTTWYAVKARPATCVRLGLKSLLDRPPDLVLSGINRGDNLGTVTWFSGTVGAAR